MYSVDDIPACGGLYPGGKLFRALPVRCMSLALRCMI